MLLLLITPFNAVVGLCQLAGNLLMHSPEEDAFWTFVALMDNHLRSYCAINSVQMEVDSVFFAKTLESNDPQLAGKLFVSLAREYSLCYPDSAISGNLDLAL
jgi:hypothetical protein